MKVTLCEDCGSTVSYKTNKPKRCNACKEKREAKFIHKKRNPIRSKKEGQMQDILNVMLPEADYVDNGYYSWMLSPKGAPLQLDRYYPSLRLAFEYNGRQHYEYNSYMHKNEAAFEYLQRCDLRKRKECKRRGITLISIKYTKKITSEYLLGRLDNAGILDTILRKTIVRE